MSRIAALFIFATAALTAQSPQLDSDLLSGLELRNIGPAAMSGRIVDLAVSEKDPYIFYVASATGGLWKTANNGVTFDVLFDDQPVHSIGDVAVHAQDDNLVWVGTGERANRQSSSWGDGVYKSTDGGKSWTNMGLADSHHIGRIALHPTDPQIVYVAAMGHLWGPNEERGLYKSSDGGESWQRVLYVNPDTGVVDVALDPSNPEIVYAAAYERRRRPYGFHGGGPGSGLYQSSDGGQSWQELGSGLPEGDKGRIGISIYRSDPAIVYVCVEQGYRYNASTAYTERRAGIYRSEDRGRSWTFMSDWNPRPMYASQILVDPSDDQRIYMMNRYSYSDDGGKTFERPRQSLHGDDRIVWVNPKDSRHVIKGDDGGVGISYDRGKTWLYVTSLPVSQFYRVSVDMRHPYWVYGGLQDNGSWAGPSAVYRSEGILNSDWIKTGGGDGFLNLVHPEDPNTLYVESQYLGLSRFDLKTRQRRNLRPGDPKGAISARRNWDAWGPGIPEPELGNAMVPANWDGPFLISPHNPHTLYAGTNILWRSTDGGDSWTSLGDLTTGVNRRDLPILGRRAQETTPSLDDGIPYYPTLTALSESPLQAGLLYAGADDGNLQVSHDGGASWTEVSSRLPGLPENAWVSGIEASRFGAGTVYAAANNYRNDDYSNYLYRSRDAGESWESISGGLPPNRVARTIREDTRNPNLLFLGTELGVFVSIDGGNRWVELKNNLPRAAVNDLVIHPRDNDLVLGTHGRGIWILDDITPLQELTPQVLSAQAHLFSVAPAEMVRRQREVGHMGDMVFKGENPPAGALIHYYLPEEPDEDSVQLVIEDAQGRAVSELATTFERGINRVVWNLRHPDLPASPQFEERERERTPQQPAGPWVVPGLYTARLTVGGISWEQSFRVEEDPRLEVPIELRRQWTEALREIAWLYRVVRNSALQVHPVQQQLEKLPEELVEAKAAEELKELDRMMRELFSRIRRLYGATMDWTGPLTELQQSQLDYYRTMQVWLEQRMETFWSETLPELNEELPEDQRIEMGSERQQLH